MKLSNYDASHQHNQLQIAPTSHDQIKPRWPDTYPTTVVVIPSVGTD